MCTEQPKGITWMQMVKNKRKRLHRNEGYMKLDRIKYWVLDVDGTMTDAGVYYDENGNEIKKFSTRDGAGLFALRHLGMKSIVLTGRECKAVKRRMDELGVDYVFQNVRNKKEFLRQFMDQHKIEKEEVAYIGDDWNDYSAMLLTGFVACPADASKEVKGIADYISGFNGGCGAVSDCIEYFLGKRGEWESAVMAIYHIDSGEMGLWKKQ